MQFLTLFVFIFEYYTLFEYIRIVSVFTNSIRYSYSFQIAKRILFGIRIRSKITIRPNTVLDLQRTIITVNKLKSLKVAQVKDEMDGDEDDGRNVVFDDVCRCM